MNKNLQRKGRLGKKESLKGLICIMAVMTLVIGLCGCSCSNDGTKSSQDASSGSKASSIQKNLDIKDFDWNVGQTKKSGKDVYTFALTNNSKYELLAAGIKYKTKSGLTPEQLSVFDAFMAKHQNYVKEGQTTADVTLRGEKEIYIPKNGSAENISVTKGIGDYSWYDSPTTQEFELMEPSELEVAVVGDDDTLYFAYYDFATQSWKMDSKTAELNKWPSMEAAKLVPKMDGHIFRSETFDSLNKCDIDVYGVSEEDYRAYIEKLKEKGFTESIEEKDFDSSCKWEAKDTAGNSVELDYDKEKKQLDIDVTGVKQN